MKFKIPYVLMHLQNLTHATYCTSRILVVFYQQFPKLKPAKKDLKSRLKFKTKNKIKGKRIKLKKGKTYQNRAGPLNWPNTWPDSTYRFAVEEETSSFSSSPLHSTAGLEPPRHLGGMTESVSPFP
jgi:hypothetical protein